MTTAELERAAYANGDARTAELLARLAELEEERETLGMVFKTLALTQPEGLRLA